MLATVLPLRSLTAKGAIEVIEYHLRRNLIAYKSHRKKALNVAKKAKAKVAL
jgi:hypothetical protein